MKTLNWCNKVIEYSFYALFLLVPLVFTDKTSELFEFNKMWLTFGLTVFVATAWAIKMTALKKFYVQRTPLDIPIAIFLISQIISTLISLDPHVSLWGYYSRFNGGLLSIFSYIILYYAFVSNFSVIGSRFSVFGSKSVGYRSIRTDELKTGKPYSDNRQLKTDNWVGDLSAVKMVKRILMTSLISGLIVALWGFPSHFGFDPTCFIFRGTLDVSCWTEDFQPKIRIFSTLGQPAWLGAYLAVLIPIALVFLLQMYQRIKMYQKYQRFLLLLLLSLLPILFYLDLLFTKSRASFLAIWLGLAFFSFIYFRLELKDKIKNFEDFKSWLKPQTPQFFFVTLIVAFFALTLFAGTPFLQTEKRTTKATSSQSSISTGGGTDSGRIRLLVWQGALNAWTHNPLFGTGVETFAFAYYKYRPVAHNLTSEWNFLYNKAHNEYLNYLATTGIFGLGSYLAIIGSFLYLSLKHLLKTENLKLKITVLALISSYLTILISNFFGFSVVIINLYFFMIPVFVFVLASILDSKKIFVYPKKKEDLAQLSGIQKAYMALFVVLGLYLLFFLIRFWRADISFALGSNLARAGENQTAYSHLHNAQKSVGFEPVFKDEAAGNDASLAVEFLRNVEEKQATQTANLASDLAKQAIVSTEEITRDHPNNFVFWKGKIRVYYILSQTDERFTKQALEAALHAVSLAPKDASINYNLALLYGQKGDTKKAIETLGKTIKLKNNYINAYYALGLFWRQAAVNEKGTVVDPGLNQKAIRQMEFILKNLDSKNKEAQEALRLWKP